MSRRLQCECKLWFNHGSEEFFGEFDQFFFINAPEPDVGIPNAWCELDSPPEDLHIYDAEGALVASTYPEYSVLLYKFEAMYDSRKGEETVKNLCWESQSGAEGRRY